MSLRLRLTVLYGGLFLLAGGALLGVTYLLFTRQVGRRVTFIAGTAPAGLPSLPSLESLDEQARRVREAAATSLLTQGAIALGAVAVLAAGLGWLVAGRALAPVRQGAGTARPTPGAGRPRGPPRNAVARPPEEGEKPGHAVDGIG